jgi:hypothetical protein
MAVVSMLLGGCVGFFSAMVGLIILNVSWIAAIGLWSGVGTLASLAVLALAALPRRRGEPNLMAKRA